MFPGLGLGTVVARAGRISNGMLLAAANAVAALSDAQQLGASLLPQVQDLRPVSASVAVEVARAAVLEGLSHASVDDLIHLVHEAMWQPEYPDIEPA